MKKLLFAGITVLMSIAAQAQPIHGNPKKAAYGSPAEWPTVSAQGHWAPSENPVLPPASLIVLDLVHGTFGNSMIGHTHVDLHCPHAAEVSVAFTCDFAAKLFHTAGEIKGFRNEFISDMVFDQDSTIHVDREGVLNKPLKGDINAVKIWTGHLTIDPTVNTDHPAPPKGWFAVPFGAITFYDNGDTMLTRLWFGFYSVKDPVAVDAGGFPFLGSRIDVHSSRHPDVIWGTDLIDYFGYVPSEPIFAPWPFVVGTAAYGGKDLPPSTVELRADLDFHAGNPGRVMNSITAAGDIVPQGWTFDPATLGAGTHRIAFMRTQPDQEEMVGSLLVFDVPVGSSVPPPAPTCQDPKAINIGQPLPCVFNAPPPPPPPPAPVLEWQSFGLGTWNVSFEREVDRTTGTATGRQRACIGGQCIAVPLQ